MSGLAEERRAPRRLVRWSGIVAFSLATSLLLASSVANSQTVTPQSVDPIQHFFDCLGVMITNPEVHAAECSPGHMGDGEPLYDLQGTCVGQLDEFLDNAGTPCFLDDNVGV